jgi:hypothetical protein
MSLRDEGIRIVVNLLPENAKQWISVSLERALNVTDVSRRQLQKHDAPIT